MNSSSWWAQKLGTEAPRNAPTPPVQMPAYRPQYQQPVAPQQPANIEVTNDNFMQAAGAWRGGEASRTETSRCPNCQGDHYFTRSNSGSRVAPRCYDCGYTDGRPMQGIPS